MAMLLHAINQAALVKSTDNSGNSCNMRARDKDLRRVVTKVMDCGDRILASDETKELQARGASMCPELDSSRTVWEHSPGTRKLRFRKSDFQVIPLEYP